MKNVIVWFEIPAINLDRATKFYETILGVSLVVMDMEEMKMRMFPVENMEYVGGAIVEKSNSHKPSLTDGPVIYLNGNPDLQLVLDKVQAAGGKIEMQKTQISPEYGFMALIIDTEGNRIGLHSGPNE